MRFALAPALLCLLVGFPGAASAEAPAVSEAATARLGLLSRSERELLSPHLERGPIAIAEFSYDTELPAIVMAARVHASAKDVLGLVRNPEAYPSFMPALDEVRIRSRRGETLSYDWTWKTAIFTLRGQNVMTVYRPAPGEESERGYRVDIQARRGDLGQGRITWHIHPEGPASSLVVLAMRIDMRNANYVARQLSSGGNGVNRTINMSLGFVMLLSTRAEAQRRSGHPSSHPHGGTHALERPSVDFQALAPLLLRGDLMLMDMDGDHVAQVAVVGRMGKSPEEVRAVMTNPESFGRSLVQGSTARVLERTDDNVLFEWKIPLPLVGSKGQMRMRFPEGGGEVSVEAVEGNLAGGEWAFDTYRYPWGEAAVLGWARFDPADASWLLERMVHGIPWFRHGLTAGSQVMVMRSIRSRVWNR